MSAQVKLASRNPGIPARRAATSGTAGASQRTAAVPSSRRVRTSSSTRAIASAWTRAARASVAAPSVAALSPGGLTAPASETCGSSAAGRRSRSRQCVEQVRVAPDHHRELRRQPVDHRHRAVQVAEAVAGHVDGEPAAVGHRPGMVDGRWPMADRISVIGSSAIAHRPSSVGPCLRAARPTRPARSRRGGRWPSGRRARAPGGSARRGRGRAAPRRRRRPARAGP